VAPPSYEPHYEGSPIVWGRQGSACGVRGQHTFEARAGHHLAPVVLSSGANIFERLASGFTLIALGGDQEPAAAFQAAATDLGIPLQVIADTFDGQRASYGQRFVLVRPDQHVAWTGNDPPADAAAVLRRAVGATPRSDRTLQ
jgi:4-hydroxyisophthalate hydroxylase